MTHLTRRQFSSRAILILSALAAPFSMTSCGIFSDILTWTAVAGTAIDGIVTVLGSLLPPSGLAIVQAAKAFLTDLAAAVTQYQNDTNPADKATLLAKIRTLLAAVAANIQSFLGQITSSGPAVNIALGLAQVILGAIMGFIGQLPATGTLALSSSVSAGGKAVTVTPKFYARVADFKMAYNAVAAAGGHAEVEIK